MASACWLLCISRVAPSRPANYNVRHSVPVPDLAGSATDLLCRIQEYVKKLILYIKFLVDIKKYKIK
jgi:hypothetical protein